MTDLFMATSVVRHAGDASASGFVRVFSMATGEVVATAPTPESRHRAADPNPRGGLRGARGVSGWGDRLVVANTERLFVLDPAWRIDGEITDPLLGGIHGILAEEDGVWVTCTMADLLVKVDWGGRVADVWEWRQDSRLTEALGYARLSPVDRTIDHRAPDASRVRVRNVVHLNSVRRGEDGRLLLSFGRVMPPARYHRQRVTRMAARAAQAVGVTWRPTTATGAPPPAVPSGTIEGAAYALVALDDEGRSEVLFRESGTRVPNHDVVSEAGLLVYCDTNRGRLVAVEEGTGAVRHEVPIPGEPTFVRGLLPLGGLEFLVGGQRPAAVHRVDLGAGSVVASYELGGHPDESVHNIGAVPEGFGPPPPTLFA